MIYLVSANMIDFRLQSGAHVLQLYLGFSVRVSKDLVHIQGKNIAHIEQVAHLGNIYIIHKR
jgi:hypothetical protein